MAKYILVHGIRVAKSFTPETFGRLTTIGPKFVLSNKQSRAYQVCQCDCGKHVVCQADCLRNGNTQSCGCLQKERTSAVNTTHGLSRTPEHKRWKGMIGRCHNPNQSNYSCYGGRGIKVCERWLGPNGYQNFLADMGRRPSDKHSIDRIDVNGDYCPENCRWATRTQQNNNTRRNIVLTHAGRSMTMAEWSREVGMPPTMIKQRLKRGWSVEEALTTPVREKRQTDVQVFHYPGTCQIEFL
jgi:hypothetical protein